MNMSSFYRRTAARELERSSKPHPTKDSLESRLYGTVMSDQLFLRLSELIQSSCGIKMPPVKKTMLEGRLRKRMRALRIDSFEEYCERVFNTSGSERELIQMIDAVTTNKTDFFREPDHFEYLVNTALPELTARHGFSTTKRLNAWSAGCSTGEEPYTLSMVLSEYAERRAGLRFSILATDISTAVLDKARTGIYDEEKAMAIPMGLRKKYLLRGKKSEQRLIRVAPEQRALVRFQRINFMEDQYGIKEPMGIIFCRNVIIYFDRPTQQRILGRLSQHLIPGGYLFVGHSESLHGMELPLVQATTTVYKKL
jgi:chemotaxis protein methyltransferase CheR